MSKRKKSAKKAGGPFLAAAVFCESIIEGADKFLSAMRIMDGCHVWLPPDAPPDVPSESKPVGITQNLLLIFRTGDSPGKHKLSLVVEQPDGKRSEMAAQDIVLSPEPHGGANIKTNAALRTTCSGTCWVDVILDGKRYTRMPLNITIQRLSRAPPAAKKK